MIHPRPTPVRRGTAEIELVLVMPLLLVLLYMALNIKSLHSARQAVLSRAVAGSTHTSAEDNHDGSVVPWVNPLEISKVSLAVPGTTNGVPPVSSLANTVHLERAGQSVGFRFDGGATPWGVDTLRDKSVRIGPSWTYLSATVVPGPGPLSVRRWYTALGRFATAGFEKGLKLDGD